MKKTFSLFLTIMAGSLLYAATPNYKIENTINEGNYTKVVVTYTSVGADGKTPATVSGMVTYPNSLKADAILMDNHFTITKDAEAPSNSTPALISNEYFTMGDKYCFTSADYLGYGATKSQAHTYLCQRQNALNSIDLMYVARDIYAKAGVQLKKDVFVNTGYSQGGGVTMAVHREMENNPEMAEELHFAGSFCGAGPYDLEQTMLWYFDQTKLSEPSLMPLVIRGLIAGGFLPGYSFKDFFKISDTNVLEQIIDQKEKSLSQISSWILSKTGGKSAANNILSDDMFNDTKMYNDFIKAAKENSLLSGWTPTYPIHVVHYANDSVVPCVNADLAISELNLSNSNYHIAPATLSSTHSDFALYFYRYIYLGKLTDMIENAGKPQGVENVYETEHGSSIMYNILGMPVNKDYHGIVIVNGEKRLQ